MALLRRGRMCEQSMRPPTYPPGEASDSFLTETRRSDVPEERHEGPDLRKQAIGQIQTE